MHTASPDRRVTPRLDTALFVVWRQGEAAGTWHCVDLSQGGLFVATDQVLSAEEPLIIRIRLGQTSLTTEAQVRWRGRQSPDGPVGYGLEFVDLTDAQHVLLKRVVHQALHDPDFRDTLEREPLAHQADQSAALPGERLLNLAVVALLSLTFVLVGFASWVLLGG